MPTRSLPCFLLLFATTAASATNDWPQFRGPTGQGHAEAGLPLSWSETENITWKTAIPGLGWSSPVIKGNQVWLTTAVDEGHSLRAICIDRAKGTVLHDVEVFQKDDPGTINAKNSHASPTPILEGKRVYVHFGAHGTACLANDGQILWRKKLEYAHRHGPAGSPVLYRDLLIVSCDGTDVQFIVALDKKTGDERWRTSREGLMAYSTPLVIDVDGTDQVVSTGGNFVAAYEPLTGKEIWRSRYDGGYSLVPRPVYGHGLVFITSGFNSPSLYAIRPNGTGDVTDSHVAWVTQKAAPLDPSPLLAGDNLFFVNDKGIVRCVDARTGDEHWQHRLNGNFSASPLFADGRIYFTDEDGRTTVIAAQDQYQELAVNQIEGRTLASLAASGKALFLRSDTHLYKIEER